MSVVDLVTQMTRLSDGDILDQDFTHNVFDALSALSKTAAGSGAQCVGIADVAGYFSNDNVEQVLAEFYAAYDAHTHLLSGGAIDVSASSSEINQALDGIISGVTALNLSALVSGGDISNILHTHSDIIDTVGFGDGSDGNAILDGTNTFSWAALAGSIYTLNRNIYCNNLTIDSGITLDPNGYYIFVNNTTTNNGIIDGSGMDGSNGGDGGDAISTAVGIAGIAGVGGMALPSGALPGTLAGRDGQPGQPGVFSSTTGLAGINGSNGTAGIDVAKCLNVNTVAGVAGAAGGAVPSYPGGAAGVASVGGAATGTVRNEPKSAYSAYSLYDFIDGAILNSAPNTGGPAGSGSGAARRTSGSGTCYSGGSAGSGGAGSAGRIVCIFTRYLTGTGVIKSNGGVGGDGGNAGIGHVGTAVDESTWGGSGGGSAGSGGNAGIIILVYITKTGSLTTQVVGGVAGAIGLKSVGGSYGGGAAGSDGEDGVIGNNGGDGVVYEITNAV